ncbi:MAG: carbohydrate-binding protein [Acidothermus sp.]|nr:carbohydrate-binding protein [Acidothermus sp.]
MIAPTFAPRGRRGRWIERATPSRSDALPKRVASRRLRRLLRGLIAATPLIGVLVPVGTAAQAAVPAPPSGWTTVWSDDFNGAAGTGVNTANWLYDTGTGYPGGAPNWGTGEVETMSSSTANVYQDGAGHLVIKPIRDANGNWTSGRIETQRTDFAAPAGGQLEIIASLQQPNPSNGLGYWPAFWALGAAARPVGATNWPSIGELDIMEDVNARSQVAQTLHCGTNPGGPCNETNGLGSGLVACNGCQTGYHTYAVVIDRRNTSAEQLRFYVDGNLNYTINESQMDTTTWQNAVDHGFFIIFDVAIGGGFPNGVCGCTTPTASTTSGAGMSIDWVAVYQSGGSSGGGTVSATSTIQAENYSAQSGTQTETTTDTGGGLDVGWIGNGDWLQYNNVDFGSTALTQFKARVASGAAAGVSGLVEVHLDSLTNPSIGSFSISNTGGWQSWTTVPANITATTGVHTVYLKFVTGSGQDFVNVNWFTFSP